MHLHTVYRLFYYSILYIELPLSKYETTRDVECNRCSVGIGNAGIVEDGDDGDGNSDGDGDDDDTLCLNGRPQ